MNTLQIGKLRLIKEAERTLLVTVDDSTQEESEQYLKELLVWLPMMKINKIIFHPGGNLTIPDWFIEALFKNGITVQYSGTQQDYEPSKISSNNPEAFAIKKVINTLDELYSDMGNLPESPKSFFGSWLEQISRDMRYGNRVSPNNPWILTFLNSVEINGYEDLIEKLLQKAYDSDENMIVSEVTGTLFDNCPKSDNVKEIFLNGIFDRQKSNRLRERFFWVFNHDFKQESIDFFINDLNRFLEENDDNELLCAEIIDFMHWNLSDHKDLQTVVNIVNNYLDKHENVKGMLHNATMQLLD